tara:strand:- start:95 stop:2887 length:2793 start_codon:yes stop_codon:yes gene_type:complete
MAKNITQCVLNAIENINGKLAVGAKVIARDRNNIGTVQAIDGDNITLKFRSPEGYEVVTTLDKTQVIATTDNNIKTVFAESVVRKYEEYVEDAAQRLSMPIADRAIYASEQVSNMIVGELEHANRVKLMNILTRVTLSDFLDNIAAKGDNPYLALESLATPRSGFKGKNPFSYETALITKNLYQQEQVIMRQIMAPANELINSFPKDPKTGTRFGTEKTRAVFTKQQEKFTLMQDFIREAHNPGSTANKQAADLAKTWLEATERARLLYNQAGGAIQRNNRWALPQPHNEGKMILAGRAVWKKALMGDDTNGYEGLLDRAAMLDNATGLQLSNARLNTELDKAYDKIVSDGMQQADAIAGAHPTSGTGLAKKHLEHRFLVFKDGDSWMSYQKQFGEADAFDIMINHIRSMSKDISSMQVFGPDAEGTVRFLRNKIENIGNEQAIATKNPAFKNKATAAGNKLDLMWNVHKGTPPPDNPNLSRYFRNYRSLLMATKLGFTSLIAFPTDMMTSRRMAKINGMSQWGAVTSYVREIFRISDLEERSKVAAELGIINDSMMDGTNSAMARFLVEENADPWFQFIADSSTRLTGLNHITEVGRRTNSMNIMNNYAKVQGLPFDELPPMMQKGLARYDIDANKWGLIRKAKTYETEWGGRKVNYLRSEDIRRIEGISATESQDLADTYFRMVLGETEVSVPTVTYNERALLQGWTPSGGPVGEVARSFAMFKSWPFAFFHNHVMRSVGEATTPMEKLSAFADITVFMMLGGAMGLQLYEIAHGRKLRDTDPTTKEGRDFWMSALSRSGGLGPIFDVVAGLGDYNQGLSGYVAGPVIGSLDDVGYALFGTSSRKDVTEGDLAGFGTRVGKTIIKHVPYQNNWMINQVFQRMVWEKVLLWNDPAYAKTLQSQQKRIEREGREYYWPPGQGMPEANPFN